MFREYRAEGPHEFNILVSEQLETLLSVAMNGGELVCGWLSRLRNGFRDQSLAEFRLGVWGTIEQNIHTLRNRTRMFQTQQSAWRP